MNLPLKQKLAKVVAIWALMSMALEIFLPTLAFALTEGPSAPEFKSFEPVGTTEMVDLFTGDFTYNIPLFELPGPNGGYPFNLAYHSGVTMDQEASWVGLGWTLNAGALNRQMRGLPDEFNGEKITKTVSMKPNVTTGQAYGVNFELLAFPVDEYIGDTKKYKGKFNLGMGLKVYSNNYRGIGYSLSPGISYHFINDNTNFGFGLDMDIDSYDGVGFSPRINITSKAEENETSFNLSFNVNSRHGLTSLGAGGGFENKPEDKKKNYSISGGSSISFANTSYSPKVDMAFQGTHDFSKIKLGTQIGPVFLNGTVQLFSSYQILKDNGFGVEYPSYGYLHSETEMGDNALMDFSRQKDGFITKQTTNLPAPIATYDIYSFTGQGVGSMFRPYRSDVGVYHDQSIISKSTSIGTGVEAGFGVSNSVGYNADLNLSSTKSKRWNKETNKFETNFGFQSHDDKYETNPLYEPYYFKIPGEQTTDKWSEYEALGGFDPVKIELKKPLTGAGKFKETGKLIGNDNQNIEEYKGRSERKKRGQYIQEFKLGDIINSSTDEDGFKEVLGEYKIEYIINSNGETAIYDRESVVTSPDAITGFTVTDPNGMRYVYGLPVYNTIHEEYLMSVNGNAKGCSGKISFGEINEKLEGELTEETKVISIKDDDNNYDSNEYDDFFSKTEIPPYPYTYLLTSILGADYVDLENDGPDEGDYGYYVKFNYQKKSDGYGWKAPYFGANLDKGLLADKADDKASFMYGQKEIYLLHSAETKTHKAEFDLNREPRKDGIGAHSRFQDNLPNQDNIEQSQRSYQLDKIRLLKKNTDVEDFLLKTVYFKHNNKLCLNVHNAEREGKLTLKELYFTYQNNNRGALSKYKFGYGFNPDYSVTNYDRWGQYKVGSNDCENSDFPYVDQELVNNDQQAAWNLKQIDLPSGSSIVVDYEAKDYAYVQDRTASQMFKLSGVGNGTNNVPTFCTDSYHQRLNHEDRTLYIELNNNITDDVFEKQYLADLNKDNIKNVGEKYQLYFKAKINLRNDAVPDYFEYISGYTYINDWKIEDISGKYYAILTLMDPKSYNIKGVKKEYHPFSVNAWNLIRNRLRKLTYKDQKIVSADDDDVSDAADVMDKAPDLFTWASDFKALFTGFYNTMDKRNFGEQIDICNSWVRLNNPKKMKYGGGARVKQIVLNDNWTTENNEQSLYGQVYDYTTTVGRDNNIQSISSGVAAYEPLVGGDEITLRYAKNYTEQIPFGKAKLHSFEGPVNENLYPGPTIGYSKVTVKSIATAYEGETLTVNIGEDQISQNFLENIPTTGKIEHEFYTAKDFPVISKETDLKIKKPIPFFLLLVGVGIVQNEKAGGTQGYSIELNDMHGKPKKISYYAQNANSTGLNDRFELQPYAYTQYVYKSKEEVRDGKIKNVLDNEVDVVVNDKGRRLPINDEFCFVSAEEKTCSEDQIMRILGVDQELVCDMRPFCFQICYGRRWI